MITAALLLGIGTQGALIHSGSSAAEAQQRRQIGARSPAVTGFAKKRRAVMAGIKSWGYQLRDVAVDDIAASPFDMVVIDHARVGLSGYEARFSPADIAAMKRKPGGGRRHVIAYLSIGEAESYRFYWNKAWSGADLGARPAWLGDMNQRWERNYPVRYWMAQWQRIIYGSASGYLDKILAAGFDGVYLDRADVFLDWQKTRPTAEKDMVGFVSALAGYARRRNGRFIVIMQNAEELLQHRGLRRAIDAIAKEDLYYGIENGTKANSAANIEWSLDHLKLARRAGRKVFLVAYVADEKKAARVRKEAARHAMLVYFATRNLDMMMGRGAVRSKAPGAATALSGKALPPSLGAASPPPPGKP